MFLLDEATPSSAAVFFLFVEGRHVAPSTLALVNHANWTKGEIKQEAVQLLIVHLSKSNRFFSVFPPS